LSLRPRVEDGADRAKQIGQVSGLLFEQRADVRAGRAVPALRGDLRDLRQRQTKAASLRNEAEYAEHVGGGRADSPTACVERAG
jgi:hypothetical protein